jgi:hypothetical protein
MSSVAIDERGLPCLRADRAVRQAPLTAPEPLPSGPFELVMIGHRAVDIADLPQPPELESPEFVNRDAGKRAGA